CGSVLFRLTTFTTCRHVATVGLTRTLVGMVGLSCSANTDRSAPEVCTTDCSGASSTIETGSNSSGLGSTVGESSGRQTSAIASSGNTSPSTSDDNSQTNVASNGGSSSASNETSSAITSGGMSTSVSSSSTSNTTGAPSQPG